MNSKPPYKFFSKEQVDQQFNLVLERCQGLTDYDQIRQTINKTFYNFPLLGEPFDQGDRSMYLYRVTPVYPNIDILHPRSFSYPPKEKTTLGRANLAGCPVFYGALNPITALREMKNVLKPGETFYLSEWKIDFTQETVAHTLFNNTVTTSSKVLATKSAQHQMELVSQLLKDVPDSAKEGFKQLLIRLGDLFSLPGKENYNVTSAYAHEVLYESHERGLPWTVSMLIYPSVEVNHNGVNVAIHPRLVESDMMRLTQVIKLTVNSVDEGKVQADISERAKPNELYQLDWRLPSYTIKSVDYDKCAIKTYNNTIYVGQQALDLRINNSHLTVRDYIKDTIDKYAMNAVSSMPFDKKIFDFDSGEHTRSIILKCKQGSQINTDEGLNSIELMQVPVTWIDDYR
jgi:hypothetical protein